MAEVRIHEGESIESALRRFKRKVQTEDIIKEVKRHSYEETPNTSAAQSARFAVEMLFKGYAASEGLLTEPGARKISHDLIKALDICVSKVPRPELQVFRPKLALFPDVDDRYKTSEKTPRELSELYRVSQSLAACITEIRFGPA